MFPILNTCYELFKTVIYEIVNAALKALFLVLHEGSAYK